MSGGADIVRSIYPNAYVTDNIRDPSSKLGRANPSSYHNRTQAAVDIRPIPGMTFNQYVDGYKQRGYGLIEAIDEVKKPLGHTTGPNWHVVLGRK